MALFTPMHVNSNQDLDKGAARREMAALVKGKGEAAGEAQKWNPGSETDLMVVVASLAKVRCGDGAQNSVGGIVAPMSQGCFREKEGNTA